MKPEDYPNPTKEDLDDPLFETIWQAIKLWDISRESCGLSSGPSGNDVMHILVPLRKTLIEQSKKAEECLTPP